MDDLVDRIVDSARARLPGAIDDNVYFELADVLKDFFKISTVWREVIRVPVNASAWEYEIESNEYTARVIALAGFTNDSNIAVGATMPVAGILRLTSRVAPGDYNAHAILNVVTKNEEQKYPPFPAWVADQYGDVLSDGIIARLMSQPAKPFSNPQTALLMARKFKSAALDIRGTANRHNMVGAQAWRFPSFAAQR